jgi:hypothetical protein
VQRRNAAHRRSDAHCRLQQPFIPSELFLHFGWLVWLPQSKTGAMRAHFLRLARRLLFSA